MRAIRRGSILAAAALIAFASNASAQEEEGAKPAEEKEAESGGLSGLLKGLGVSDVKIPDSVTNFTGELTDLKDAYLETAKSVEALQKEVAVLREELVEIKVENEVLRAQLKAEARAAKLDPDSVIAAKELAGIYAEDSVEANKRYLNNYLTVVGRVRSIETSASGESDVNIVINSQRDDFHVKCLFRKGADFNVEAVPHQGRLVSLPERTTVLQIGQPVTISGTCEGKKLDVVLANCRIEMEPSAPKAKE